MMSPLHRELQFLICKTIRAEFHDRRACIISPWIDGVIAGISSGSMCSGTFLYAHTKQS